MYALRTTCAVLLAAALTYAAGPPQSGPRLRPIQRDGRWGYADHAGRVVIAPRYDEAGEFDGGLAKVGVKEAAAGDPVPRLRWGYIDEGGRVLVELRYDALRDFSEGLAAAAVLAPGEPETLFTGRGRVPNLRWGYVDGQGREVVAPQYLAAGDFSEGLAHVGVPDEGGSSLCGRGHKFGYVDRSGAMRIGPRFALATPFRGGRARVGVGRFTYAGRCLCCGPRFNGVYGYVDREGGFTPDDPLEQGQPVEEFLD